MIIHSRFPFFLSYLVKILKKEKVFFGTLPTVDISDILMSRSQNNIFSRQTHELWKSLSALWRGKFSRTCLLQPCCMFSMLRLMPSERETVMTRCNAKRTERHVGRRRYFLNESSARALAISISVTSCLTLSYRLRSTFFIEARNTKKNNSTHSKNFSFE